MCLSSGMKAARWLFQKRRLFQSAEKRKKTLKNLKTKWNKLFPDDDVVTVRAGGGGAFLTNVKLPPITFYLNASIRHTAYIHAFYTKMYINVYTHTHTDTSTHSHLFLSPIFFFFEFFNGANVSFEMYHERRDEDVPSDHESNKNIAW